MEMIYYVDIKDINPKDQAHIAEKAAEFFNIDTDNSDVTYEGSEIDKLCQQRQYVASTYEQDLLYQWLVAEKYDAEKGEYKDA